MKSSLISAAAFACLTAAAPTQLSSRAALTDADILNYALTLEHLEDTFYRQGLQKFTKADFAALGYGDFFYTNLQQVANDEREHVKFLTMALSAANAKPVAECTYKFPYTDAKSFLATASVLEGVGVSAYLGAAADITSKKYLTAAGSILTTEARHSSYIRQRIGQRPFASPFDNPLDFNEVYTLAAQFIVKCPDSNPKLPLKPFPALTATSKDKAIKAGSTVSLKVAGGKKLSGNVSGAFITVTGPVAVDVKAAAGGYSVVVPEGIAGQSYLVLTKDSKNVNDDTVLAGPAVVEVSGTA